MSRDTLTPEQYVDRRRAGAIFVPAAEGHPVKVAPRPGGSPVPHPDRELIEAVRARHAARREGEKR